LAGVRLGLLGGTFDPPHLGHLVAAQEAAAQLDLARVLFLPARQNPLKQDEQVSPAHDRCRMVELAIADNPRFELSRLDLDRPPPSYTVDLLRTLAVMHPGAELFFLIGADILPELPRWHRLDEVTRLATLAAINRPGAPILQEVPAGVRLLSVPGVAISSTELRARVQAGLPIRYLTPDPVVEYIYERRLYGRSGH
jgi:nicotinate-nucleotide adenylyltransferase